MFKIFLWLDYCTLMYRSLYFNKGVGEGGGRGGGHVPPHFQKWGGAQVGLCPPPHFWAEQMFLFHYLLIFCG